MADQPLARLEQHLAPLQQELYQHPLYAAVTPGPTLALFMERHVFAVWDFMSLAKRLQRELTCTELPWFPPEDSESARFINEVVLGEETDVDPDGKAASHLDLYLGAMAEVGARTTGFESFLARLRQQPEDIISAMQTAEQPQYICDFVIRTLQVARFATPVAAAADFLFGREDPIPDMFQRLLDRAPDRSAIAQFAYYLERHIELDGEHHGPIARRLLSQLAGGSEEAWELATEAAQDAIQSRIALWDGILEEIQAA